MNMDAALQTFFTESRELLEDMESQLLQLEGIDEAQLQESLNAVFRAAHTIKGSAGIFNLDFIVAFTHVVESVLDRLRNQQIAIDEALVSLLLSCRDHIAALVDAAEAKEPPDVSAGEPLLAELQQYLAADAQPTSHAAATQVANTPPPFERMAADAVSNDCWHISVRFGLNSFRDGMDPLSFLTYLGTLGNLVSVTPLAEFIPALEQYDCESCYLGFAIQFASQASKQEIEDVFEFVKEDSELHIISPNSQLTEYIQLIESMPEIDQRLGEILLQCGALTAAELQRALSRQQQQQPTAPIGEILAHGDASLNPVLDAALTKQSKVRESLAKEQKSLRVDADKLDHLINLVGELVTAGAGTSLLADSLGDGNLCESVSILNGLLEEVRDAALKLRMVPIGATFSRFQRVVRDIAKELGKDIELQITGAETELDKSVVEKIGDPLMHLVRNAIDHGIESQATRLAQGKSERGEISLHAYHDSGNIVIEVGDDGKGLDPEVIRRKAIEKGLLDEQSNLSDEELFNIIFEPGFSTAAQVSNLSGRGVGMDVVKRNIADLRGRVEVLSQLGQGSTMRIILPLTLAIIDGFVIGVADEQYVLPLDTVLECLELNSAELDSTDEPYINLRGQVLPLIFLRDYLAVRGSKPRRQSIVVVQSGGQSAGIVVDRLYGEFQTVIKPLGKLFSRVGCVSGSTILGNGTVALILDIHGLLDAMIAYEQLQYRR
ncbi:chemotaxis protein CheA [Shewanella sp. C32]|uniref:Chemotaxis protein CheA n=1 Tax=Shewanella electrica TaxID=515560 RepID=A0ABT2FJY2_9GAMM|nr:chemotaxis protein CheA [Shewanella electrica]MCH1924072.1 chemotaxis protein CheA [Shewanella electrica]MCS4555975.1 chemotaxis protein CheA [Shewanella electrica]